jgi:hypothetical protein
MLPQHDGLEVKFHNFLISILGGYEWLASCYGRLNPKERVSSTFWLEKEAGLSNESDC